MTDVIVEINKINIPTNWTRDETIAGNLNTLVKKLAMDCKWDKRYKTPQKSNSDRKRPFSEISKSVKVIPTEFSHTKKHKYPYV